MVDFAINMSMDFMIPFIFVLAIVFGSLELTGIFKNKAVHFMIALAISLFASTYQPFITVLWANIGIIIWFFIAMFFILFVTKVIGLRGGKKVTHEALMIYGVVLFVLLAVGWTAIERLSINLPYIGGGENLYILIAVVIILVIFFLAFKMGTINVLEEEINRRAAEKAKGG